MGNITSRALSKVWPSTAAHTEIVIVGMGHSGKKTVLQKLTSGEMVWTSPEIGFNVATVRGKNAIFHLFTVQCVDQRNPYWGAYLRNASVILFIVDASIRDTEFIGWTKGRFDQVTNLEVVKNKKPKVLILANKQDDPNALRAHEVADILNLQERKDLDWHVQETNGLTGQGLYEGFQWVNDKK